MGGSCDLCAPEAQWIRKKRTMEGITIAQGPIRGGSIPPLGARIPWESMVDRSPDGAGCGKEPWTPTGVNLNALFDVPRDGASEVPANLPRAGDPTHIVGSHRYVPPDSDRVLRCLALWKFSKKRHTRQLLGHVNPRMEFSNRIA